MRAEYLRQLHSEAVGRAQSRAYGREALPPGPGAVIPFGPEERYFISQRESFYMASHGGNGWPYVQHRGGPQGFVRVLESGELAFADYNGNRQLLSTGNVEENSRVSLFFMDYRARERLKLIGRARVVWPEDFDAELAALVAPPRTRVERAFVIKVVGFDWNCPKYIPPRFSEQDVLEAIQPLQQRIFELEAKLAELNKP